MSRNITVTLLAPGRAPLDLPRIRSMQLNYHDRDTTDRSPHASIVVSIPTDREGDEMSPDVAAVLNDSDIRDRCVIITSNRSADPTAIDEFAFQSFHLVDDVLTLRGTA